MFFFCARWLFCEAVAWIVVVVRVGLVVEVVLESLLLCWMVFSPVCRMRERGRWDGNDSGWRSLFVRCTGRDFPPPKLASDQWKATTPPSYRDGRIYKHLTLSSTYNVCGWERTSAPTSGPSPGRIWAGGSSVGSGGCILARVPCRRLPRLY